MNPFLATLPLLRVVPVSETRELEARSVRHAHEAGETLFQEGAAAGFAWFVIRGAVRIVRHDSQGAAHTLEIVLPGQIFAAVAVLDRKPYPASAVTVIPSATLTIPADLFRSFLDRHPQLVQEIFAQVGARMRHAQIMRALAQESVERRLAHVLLWLAETMGPVIRYSRTDLAEMAGTTTETTIRTLNRFRDAGWIETGWKRFALKDPAALQKTAAL